jgi:hypothetical protein
VRYESHLQGPASITGNRGVFDKTVSTEKFLIRPLAKVFLCHGLTRIFTDFKKFVVEKSQGKSATRLMQEFY